MILSYVVLLDLIQVNNLTHVRNGRSQEMLSESHLDQIHISLSSEFPVSLSEK